MNTAGKMLSITLCAIAIQIAASVPVLSPGVQAQEAGQNGVARRIGSIKAITGSAITLAPDSGSDVSVSVVASTRIVRIAPGEKNLKNATPIQLSDLQVGDRILVGGKTSEDAKSLIASSIVVMKQSDLEARTQQNLQDWQKRGVDGLVRAVDLPSGAITMTVPGLGGGKEITVQTSKDTVMRRYAANSAKFADAKPSSLEEVRPGDQLHARGAHSADGSVVNAEEIVAGSFRNIEGTVNFVDAGAGTISIQDLLSKKTVQVRVTAESQLRKLPEEVARFATQWKGAAAGPNAAISTASPEGTAGNGQRGATGHAPDLNRMLSHMPTLPLTELHKGDAVLIVATDGVPPSGGSVTKLLSGVEPILQAAPGTTQALMLTPWNLSGPNGDAGSQ